MLRSALVWVSAVLWTVGNVSGQTIVYVDDDAAPGGDGTSWASAFDDLVDALAAADAAPAPVEVWIAQGTYVPTSVGAANPRDNVFTFTTPLVIRGEFDGTEATPDDRVIGSNPVVLSGDVNGDDAPGFQNREDNLKRILDAWSAGVAGAVIELGSGFAGPSGSGGYSVFGNETEPAAPPCPTDLDGSNATDFGDLLVLLSSWGACERPPCPADFDASGAIDFGDLLTQLSAWGPCPAG